MVAASRAPMLPPPAMVTRLKARSTWRSSAVTELIWPAATMKKTSSPASMEVAPVGTMGSVPRKMAATRVSTLGNRLRTSRNCWPTKGLPAYARTATNRTLPSAKSRTCRAPGFSKSNRTLSVTTCSGLMNTSTGMCSSANRDFSLT